MTVFIHNLVFSSTALKAFPVNISFWWWQKIQNVQTSNLHVNISF